MSRGPDRTIVVDDAWLARVPKTLIDLNWIIGEDKFERVEISETLTGSIEIKIWDRK